MQLVLVLSLRTPRTTKLTCFVRGIGQRSLNLRVVGLFPPEHLFKINISAPATRNEFNNIITKEYNDLMKDIPKDDITVRREKLKDIYEWSKASSVIPSNKLVKSIAAKLENAKVQFSGLVGNLQLIYMFIHSS